MSDSTRDTPKEATDTAVLTTFQIDAIRAFFSIQESNGFLLAGGAGLVAQQLSNRPTQDLDFFTSFGRGEVTVALAGLIREATRREWTVEILIEQPTFARLQLTRAAEKVLVDLAVDSRPERPETLSPLGPTFSSPELAGRKTIALFDRAAARDFVDVHALAAAFGTENLLIWAAEVDAGFDPAIFAQMLRHLPRFKDHQLPIASHQVTHLRQFFAAWADELETITHQ
jgi:hypothetical protein